MSLFKPRALFAAVALIAVGALSACGYTPLYGKSSGQAGSRADVQTLLSGIEVALIPDRVGQMMRTELQRGLSPKGPQAARGYQLNVTLSEGVRALAIAQDAFATRANLHLTASYSLVRKTDAIVVASGSSQSVASYNILNSEFATQSAQNDARERTIVNLAQNIQTRLAAYFNDPNALSKGAPPGGGGSNTIDAYGYPN